MIEITLLDDKNTPAAAASAGLEPKVGMLVYEAVEGGKHLGRCLFGMEGGEGQIYGIFMCEEGLMPIADGLLRSALSLMCGRGISPVTCAAGGVADRLLVRAGFKNAGGVWHLELKESFFAGCAGEH